MLERRGDGRIGDAVPRKEDLRLLRGKGLYSDDYNAEGQAYAVMIRSPHAHARIVSVDKSSALDLPGVYLVLTGADVIADDLKPIPHVPYPSAGMDINLVNRDGTPPPITPQHVLPLDRARYAGEAVVMVVAASVAIAKDAAERVEIVYEPLTPVTVTADAALSTAPRLWEELPSNVCIDADVGNREATDKAFDRADHIVRIDTWVKRVTGVPMEPRAALGIYDAKSDRYSLFAGSGGVNRQKYELATILGVPEEKVRVVSGDVGGNFGTRNSFFPEFALIVWASRRLNRPVKWTATREEAFLSDYQGRDLHVEAELALDSEGNFLGLRGSNISNIGAYTASIVPLTKGVEIMTGVYKVPTSYFRARGVLSNTPSTAPYRSAGRPEVIFVIERLVDMACRNFNFDPIQLRLRNLIPPDAMPFPNGLGMTYDSGDYIAVLESAVKLGDWDGFERRRQDSRARGRLRGRGIASYVETSSGAPRERAEVIVKSDRTVELAIGTLSSGQGHETSFAQLITEFLGVPTDQVTFIQGDTDIVPVGGGSHSGRSMRLAGIVVGNATTEIIEKAKRIVAHIFEASPQDVEFANSVFRIAGTDKSMDLFDVAAAAAQRNDLPDDLRGELSAESDIIRRIPSFPYGCHVCEVEVDADTGNVALLQYAAVDDVGRAVNPLILHGQAHGGIVQGLGQAMSELCYYEAGSGQMLSASFMDYAMPRAESVPSFLTEISECPSPNNPLGIRAGGEGGTTGALAVFVNAVVDALSEYDIKHVEMPTTAESIWQAIQAAKERHSVS